MSGIVTVKNGDESSLLAAVYSVGPVSVAVDARSNAFKVITHSTEFSFGYSHHSNKMSIKIQCNF